MKKLAWIALVFLIGCDSNESVDLNSVAQAISEKATELNEAIDPETLTDLQNLFAAFSNGLESGNIAKIREKSKEIDDYLGSRIWGWYAEIYEAYLAGGSSAAEDKIKSIEGLYGTRQYERDALDAISKGLESNLGLKDGTILESVAVQSLRSKFGDMVAEVVVTVVLGALVACRHGC